MAQKGLENDSLTIIVIAGTRRQERQSIKAAHYVAEYGRALPDVEIIFVDPKDYNLPDDGVGGGASDPRYTEVVEKADAFFIVTPEYNHSFPGSLKRLLDSEYDLYHRKPVALAGVSSGPWGGVRVCEALLPVCHRLGLVNIHSEVYFPEIQNTFEENGHIKAEKQDIIDQSVRNAFKELIWFAKVLKQARTHI